MAVADRQVQAFRKVPSPHQPAADFRMVRLQPLSFDFGERQVLWTHRTWGAPPDPDYPWGATFYGDRGTLKCSVHRYDFAPIGRPGQAQNSLQIIGQFVCSTI